jgi:hypothetical protein
MKRLDMHRAMKLGLIVAAVGVTGIIGACSSSTSSSSSGSSSSPDSGGCSSTTALNILFNPMYSAFDGTHTFQIPAVVNGIDNSTVKWTASDTTVVSVAPDSDTGGIMLTALKAGTVTINAEAGSLCGSSVLTITSATTDDWNAGSARYNDGVVLRRGPPGDAGDDGGDAGPPPQEAACTNCHGPTANGPFIDIAHTPEQTGGFSDDDLVGIFTMGQVPDGGYFDTSIIAYNQWQRFHQWDMTSDEAKGVVVYLRSLTPAAQDGTSAFGGHFDGGRRDGGGHFDGGGPPGDGG